jgi:hypothetical protein
MNRFIIIILSLSLSFSLSAQKDFREGFIIISQGDTTFGEVAYRTNKTSALITHFRENKKSEISTYTPKDLIGFGYNDDKYMESISLGGINTSGNKVFVEIIFKGEISLYRYKNDYLLIKNEELNLITNRELVELDDGEKVLRYSDNDIKTIALLVADCNQSVIDQAKFKINDKHLVNMLTKYHACINKGFQVFKTDKSWSQINLGVYVGSNNSNVKFKSANQQNNYLTKNNIKSKPTFVIGVETNISWPRVTDAYQLVLGIQYMNSKNEGNLDIDTPQGIRNYHASINMSSLTLPLGLKYMFPEKSITPYFSGGINWRYFLNMDKEFFYTTIDGTRVDLPSPYESKPSQLGFWFSFGAALSVADDKSLFLELKYELANGLNSRNNGHNFDLETSVTNLQILLGFRL